MKKILFIISFVTFAGNTFGGWLQEGVSFVAYDGASKIVLCKYVMTGDKVTRSLSVSYEYKDIINDSLIMSSTIFSWNWQTDSIKPKGESDIPVNGCVRNGILTLYTANNDIYTVNISKNKFLWKGHSDLQIAAIGIADSLLYIAKKNGELKISTIENGNNVSRMSSFLSSISNMKINEKDRLIAFTNDNHITYFYDLKSLSLLDSIENSNMVCFVNKDEVLFSSPDNILINYSLKNRKINNQYIFDKNEDGSIISIINCDNRFIAVELKGSSQSVTILNKITGEKLKTLPINKNLKNYYKNYLLGYKSTYLVMATGKQYMPSIFEIAEDKTGPSIVIVNPVINEKETFKTEDDFIFIKGKASDVNPLIKVVVNNEQVPFLPQSGEFNGYIRLDSGLNKIAINATDIYNNTSIISLDVFKNNKEKRGFKAVNTDEKTHEEGLGYTYHALIIAEQDYTDEKINDLSFTILDAENFRKILSQYYTFNDKDIKLLINPSRNQIINNFDSLLNVITKKDHLLIFYAGHGVYDEKLKQGYWLPSDADLSNKGTWVSNNDIRDYIAGIDSRHTLLISDACFSGSILEFNRDVSFEQVADKLLAKNSRTAMTSGLDNPVPDKSLFLQSLLKNMVENTKPLIKASEFFVLLQETVLANTDNIPQYGVIKNANHEGGEFLFLRRK